MSLHTRLGRFLVNLSMDSTNFDSQQRILEKIEADEMRERKNQAGDARTAHDGTEEDQP